MGLDMNLEARRYVSKYDDAEFNKKIQQLDQSIPDGCSVSGVELRVGYWRKANAIHKWFVDNVQDGVDDCRECSVSLFDLALLRESILEVSADPDRAEELLPTQTGFFFGDTEYDEYYMDQLNHTLDIIARAERLVESGKARGVYWSLYYRASW